MRRSKIVCTLGPAVDSYEQLKALIEAGMNVARFNMSHGSHAEHEDRYRRVRQASADTGRAVGVLADLQGPKIRLETFAEGPVELVRGDEFTITTEDVAGDKSVCGTTYKGLPGDVAKGDPILINDGNVELKVTEVEGPARQDHRHRGRGHLRPQGHQPARRGGQRPGPLREGHRGPALRPADGVRPGRPLLRPGRRGRQGRPQGDGRGGPPGPGHRQGREAAGGRQHGGGRARLRRRDGGPWRPRGGVSAGEGADGAEAPGEPLPPERQAGDRGDPDDGVDDHQLPPDPRRGLRRRQRHPGRRRRGDALRRVQRRRVPDRDGQDDVEDRRRRRAGAALARPPAAGPGQETAHPGRCRGPRRRRDRRLPRRPRAGGVHQVR